MSLYLILMGAQGAGKGVQAGFIKDQHYVIHLSTGDLFRAMKTRSDTLAKRVQDIMNAGQLVPDDVTNEVVRDRLEQPDAANGAIFDGYPRTQAQSEWLEGYLAQRGAKLNAVIELHLDLYTAFKRAFGRVTAANGDSYNLYFGNEGLDIQIQDDPAKTYPPRMVATLRATGETLQRRPDDANAHAIIKRIDTYVATTRPLLAYYQGKGLLRQIDADQPIEAVRAAIEEVIGNAVR